MPSMRLSHAALLLVAVTVAGCGEQSEGDAAADGTHAGSEIAPTTGDLDTFCAAIAVLDTHDGTTEASIAVPAIEEARDAAPAAIRGDVELLTTTLIVNNYPSNAEPSMTAAPPDQLTPASGRLADFVEQNCDSDR